MENLNIAPFYIGQKVEYITGINMPKGSKHTITDIWKKPCGCYDVWINGIIRFNENKPANWYCASCKKDRLPFQEKRGWSASSFRPIQQQTFPLMTYSKVIEKEPVSAN